MSGARNQALRVGIVLVSLGLWETGVRILHVPAFILPAPSRAIAALYRGTLSGVYLDNLWITLVETLLGFVAGSLVAFLFGTAVGLSRTVEYFLYPYVVMFQSMPKVALAPLIIVWFGLGLTSKVVSAALVAFFPLLVNTIVGLRSADEDRVNLMRSLAATDPRSSGCSGCPRRSPSSWPGSRWRWSSHSSARLWPSSWVRSPGWACSSRA